jgi:hypothetical protein
MRINLVHSSDGFVIDTRGLTKSYKGVAGLADESGWRRGFANLLRKEFSLWWRTRKWGIHLLIWLALINGMVLMMALLDENPPAQRYGEAITVFFVLSGFAAGI